MCCNKVVATFALITGVKVFFIIKVSIVNPRPHSKKHSAFIKENNTLACLTRKGIANNEGGTDYVSESFDKYELC